MIEIIIIIIILVLTIIYLIQRNSARNDSPQYTYSAEYYRGLNYLLNNEDDKALKIFTDLIDVDSSTIETHLALGGVYRRRGEFDKAILIHQNLLSRPNLDKSIKNQSLYELSKDFFSAGLYDKSEKILFNLKDNKNYLSTCNEYLLLIYELSKDWDKAINLCKNLKVDSIRNISRDKLLSNYYCEKSQDYRKDNQTNKSITVLKKAIDIDDQCTRAYKYLFELNMNSNFKLSFDYLKKLIQIKSDFILISSNEILKLSYLHQNENLDEMLYELIINNSNENLFSPEIYEFLFNLNDHKVPEKYITKMNDNIFANIYINLHTNEDNAQESQPNIIELLKDNFVSYKCNNCGYVSNNYVWKCPSCNRWETIDLNTINDKMTIDA
tara:strand:- start:1863 stop:3011 length:1149 start_codon:yes stop_codon:yes gene_type:complete